MLADYSAGLQPLLASEEHMGVGLITIRKQYSGKYFTSSHGFSNISFTGAADQTDIDALYENTPDLTVDSFTNPTQDLYKGATSLLAAIIGFERILTQSTVNFVEVIVTDGATPGSGTGPFFSLPINVQGHHPLGSDTLGPLATTLLVKKVPIGTSHKGGRLFMRGVLVDNDVEAASNKYGIDLKSGVFSSYQTDIPSDVIEAHLDVWFVAAPVSPPIAYAIPKYVVVTGAKSKAIAGGVACGNFALDGVAVHQTVRGRKRKVVV
jgi:hypothetical protein